MNNTSTRSPESLQLIVDTIMSNSSEFASANSVPSQANTLMLDFSQKISKSITLEYLAGLIDGDGRRLRADFILVQLVHELLAFSK